MLKSELAQKVMEVFGGPNDLRDFEVEFPSHDPACGTLCIRIQQMYEYVDVTFDNLAKIAEICQTKNINIGDKDCHGGCETCDYGSCYMVDLYLGDFWIPLEDDPLGPKTKEKW